MAQVVTIGLDLAKSVFQVHGVDSAGEVVVRRQIRRSQLLQFFAKQPVCRVGMEACASSHYWARGRVVESADSRTHSANRPSTMPLSATQRASPVST